MAKKKVKSKRKLLKRRPRRMSEDELLEEFGIARNVLYQSFDIKILNLKRDEQFGITFYYVPSSAKPLLQMLGAHPLSIVDAINAKTEAWDEEAAVWRKEKDLPSRKIMSTAAVGEALGRPRPQRLPCPPYFPFMMLLIFTRKDQYVFDELVRRNLVKGRPPLMSLRRIKRWRAELRRRVSPPLQKMLDGKMPKSLPERKAWELYLKSLGVDPEYQLVTLFNPVFQDNYVRVGFEALLMCRTTMGRKVVIAERYYNLPYSQEEIEAYLNLFYRISHLHPADQELYLESLPATEREQKRDALTMPFDKFMVTYRIPTKNPEGDTVRVMMYDASHVCLKLHPSMPGYEKAVDQAVRAFSRITTLARDLELPVSKPRRPWAPVKKIGNIRDFKRVVRTAGGGGSNSGS